MILENPLPKGTYRRPRGATPATPTPKPEPIVPRLIPCSDSSAIRAFWYDADREILSVIYKGGATIYASQGVTAAEFATIYNAKSRGQAISRLVKTLNTQGQPATAVRLPDLFLVALESLERRQQEAGDYIRRSR